MKGKIVKTIAITLAVLIAAGGAGYGVITWLRSRNGEVNVYEASNFITDADWFNTAQTDGIVSTDRIQSVYLSSTQVVTEIYVQEGQTVKAGDPLMAFDTTLSELNLHRQAIKVDQLELNIRDAQKEIEKINTYRVGTGSSGGYFPEPEPEAPLEPVPSMPFQRTEEALGTQSDPLIFLWNEDSVFSASFIGYAVSQAMTNREAFLAGTEPGPAVPVPVDPGVTTPEPTSTPESTAAPTQAPETTDAPEPTDEPEPTEGPVIIDEPEPEPEPEPEAEPEPEPEPEPIPEPEPETDGIPASSSRKLAPARKLSPAPMTPPAETAEPAPIDPELLAEINDPHVYVVFEVRDSDAVEGSLLNVWELVMLVDNGAWSFRVVEPNYDPGGGEDLDDYGYSAFYFDDTVYYSAEELARMKTEANQKLTDLRLNLRQAQLEYERLEYELSNGEVFAKLDGVVKTVRDPDEARAERQPLLLVSGGGGYFVTAVLGEFDLGSMQVGDTVSVQSWESGISADGVIREISPYPDESDRFWYYSDGNENVSKYPFRVFVDEDASLRDGESVTITYASSGGGTAGLYLQTPFIRTENGKSYIFVRGEDGLLEKRFVAVGHNLWGSYIEITEGLSEDDWIAFPYGRGVTDGAKTREADPEALYPSAYYG